MLASFYNNLSIVEYFIDKGIDINSVDDLGENAIFHVNFYNESAKNIYNLLFNRGINLFHKRKDGNTLFDILIQIYSNNIIYNYNDPRNNILAENMRYLINEIFFKKYMPSAIIDDPKFSSNSKILFEIV